MTSSSVLILLGSFDLEDRFLLRKTRSTLINNNRSRLISMFRCSHSSLMVATMTTTAIDPKPRKVCFSFAAYAKNVIDHLKSSEIPVIEGLTDAEFSSIEACFNFTFPPDLRSILCEGLPVGPGFPNWRSSSLQQLEILINLPILGICKEISKRNFWCESWGDEPDDSNEALIAAKQFLKKAPVLVPIYKHCYIPSMPNLAGNPVFFVQGGELRYSGFDVAGFFQQVEFRQKNIIFRRIQTDNSSTMKAPAWAAKTARRIEFWSDLVENCTCGMNGKCGRWRWVLGDYFEEMSWRLRDGGWTDEEVKEMMTTTTTVTDGEEAKRRVVLREKESVVWHVRYLSIKLLRAGWSKEDVVYSLGFNEGEVDFQVSTTESRFSSGNFVKSNDVGRSLSSKN